MKEAGQAALWKTADADVCRLIRVVCAEVGLCDDGMTDLAAIDEIRLGLTLVMLAGAMQALGAPMMKRNLKAKSWQGDVATTFVRGAGKLSYTHIAEDPPPPPEPNA